MVNLLASAAFHIHGFYELIPKEFANIGKLSENPKLKTNSYVYIDTRLQNQKIKTDS